ncbi:hypothetical protein A7U60_g2018 [Sanghuangporus baumii]|uniref:Uncharacterized protein n=1 Tax=Sanghuangporus baumii TaxID=108892 RepID=A0A9Q5N8I3_SANBA|nr:hypothetical protein A7U60_g2018 [Sanghuangporus baumii]
MRSFSIFSLAATLALSAFSSAAPLTADGGAHVDVKVNTRELADVDLEDVKILSSRDDLVDVDVEDVKILSSRDDPPSIPKILNDLTAELSPVVDKINALTGADDLVAQLGPLINQAVDIVGTAVSDVNALVGEPVATVLASVDGKVQVSVSDVAQLTSGVLTLVVSALGAVLKVVNGDLSNVGSLLSSVNDVLTQLVSGLTNIVGGLLSELLPLVGGLVPTLTSLSFTTLGSVLNLVL